MAWPTETIIALVTLLIACLPLLVQAWFYVNRMRQRRRTIGTDLLPLHRTPSYLAPRALNDNEMDIPGLLINLNQLERSLDMQIFVSADNPFPIANIPIAGDSLNTLRRITTGLSSISV
ncbi:hypothetical protein TMatcc_001801 [Talaromyces marneffei ATCC 18224]|uniref:Uncharacterized protein n=1 Tax=Talaromyces marneffei PM1 TaxID=1077442 RepID=A0A093UPL3_TALMA|nr:uncharacterized protein EYB26_007001 [Talaromyces marneffei]KAE8551815.1 hypothetical protein EYB25_005705 [Talaromyces marneffei]QGA19312.1 hypothetical protein EYB26_007001 [Talaromyces marneffei]